MAVLTWKNVDAPNMSGAGALLESANNSFQNAMGTLQKAADRSQMQQRAAASARMLQGLAGVKNADDVAAFLANQDASMLTDEAMKIALGQADVLQGRAVKEIELQNARGDLDWEQQGRTGAIEAARNLALAQQAAARGDVDGAFAASQGLDGRALMAFNDGSGNFLNDATNRQNLEETRYSFGRTVENDENADIVTQKISDLRGSANNVAEARQALVNDQSLSAKQKEDAFTKLNAMDDSAFNFADPSTPASFSALGLNDEAAKQNNANVDMDFIQRDVESSLQSLPSYNYKTHLSNITAVQGDREAGKQAGDEREIGQGYFDPVNYLKSTVGISADRSIPFLEDSSIIQSIEEIKKEAETKSGKKISDHEAAAAIAASAQSGSWWRGDGDKRRIDTTSAVNLLLDMKDPSKVQAFTAEEAKIRGGSDTIKQAATKVDQLLAKAQNQLAKGQTEAAAKTRAEAVAAQDALLQGISNWQETNYPSPRNKDVKGPDIPQSIVDAALSERQNAVLQENARKAQALAALRENNRRNRREPVDIVLPNGTISREFPSIMGDGNYMREIDW